MSELKARLNKRKNSEPFTEPIRGDKPASSMSDLEMLLKTRKISLPNIKEQPSPTASQPEFMSHTLKPVRKKVLSKVEEDEAAAPAPEFQGVTLRKVSTSSISSIGSANGSRSNTPAAELDADLVERLSKRRDRMTRQRTDEVDSDDDEADDAAVDGEAGDASNGAEETAPDQPKAEEEEATAQ